MATNTTKLAQLVNPEVMADMISATLPYQLKFSKIAAIDTTLEGQAGNTITVPKFGYIGAAADVSEGVAIPLTQMSTTTDTVTIKKVGKAVDVTDEAALSGYGDPVGEAVYQLGLSIAQKVDEDCQAALEGAPTHKDVTTANISYLGVVEALDLFEDEQDTVKVMYVHPKQVTQLRKDSNFIDYNKYPHDVIFSGEIGQIAGVRVIKSKAVSKKTVSSVECYVNPIVVTDIRDPKEETSADKFANTKPALTIYMKRGVVVESDRDILAKTTTIAADQHYGASLSNDSKVVVANFKAA